MSMEHHSDRSDQGRETLCNPYSTQPRFQPLSHVQQMYP
jgi:hypothetical protein